MAEAVDERIVAGARRAFGRWGVRRSSVDDIARESGVSRATVYRAFPGGREAITAAVVSAELGELRALVQWSLAADLETTLTRLIVGIAHWFETDPAVRFVVAHEPDVVGPALAFEGGQRTLAIAADVIRPALEPFVAPARVDRAADWLVRLIKSHLFDPSSHVALADTESVLRLVRTFLLPALASGAHRQDPS